MPCSMTMARCTFLLKHVKHSTTLFSLFDHYILSPEHAEWRVIIMVDLWCYHGYNQSAVTKLLIMKDPYYGWMCF